MVTSQNVGGNGRDFESDKNQQQLHRTGQQAHPHRAEDDQRIELALVMAVLRQCIQREQQGHQHNAADQHVEEYRKGAGLNRRVEAGPLRQ